MSLAECISCGISSNLSLQNARVDIRKSKLDIKKSCSKLLPVVQGVVQITDYLKSPVNVTTGTLLGNDFPDNPTWQTIKTMQYTSNAGIQMTMPLYNQTVFAAISVAKTIDSIYNLSYEKAVEDLTMQICKVYYLAQTSKEILRLTDLNLSRMEKLCEITQALYCQGMVMEVDMNRVNIRSKMLESEKAVTNALYEQQLNLLRYLMNMEQNAPLEVVQMADTFIRADLGEMSYQLPEIKLAGKQKELILKKIDGVKAGFIPSLSLSGYAGGLGYFEKLSGFSDNWFGNCYIAVTLKVPIFEANSKNLQIKQYRNDVLRAENIIEMIRKRTEKDFADALLQMDKNMEIVDTQVECRRQAESVYFVTEEQYKEGVASMTSLLQDDMQFRNAQSACVQAVCQCKLAQLELLRLTGNLDKLLQ